MAQQQLQHDGTTNNSRTRQVSLDTLRKTRIFSEFERLMFANMPRGEQENVVQTLSYRVADSSEIKQLKTEVFTHVTDGENVTWTDTKKMRAVTDNNTEFDFDLYLRFGNSPGMVNRMALNQLLSKSLVRPIISSEQDEAAFLNIEITDKTHLWMEMCTTPSMARYKLYQLFRAAKVLQLPQDENIVGIICLNGNWDDTEAVADLLRGNPFVNAKAAEFRMDLAIAWTKHNNIYTSLMNIEGDIGSLKKDMQQQMEELKTDVQGIKNDIQEIKNALAPRPWGRFFKTLIRGQRGN